MRRTRLVFYSTLAVPFVALACFLISMDSVGRKSFVSEFRRNTSRMLAGEWDFSELRLRRRTFNNFLRRGRSGEADPRSIFARLDRDDDEQLSPNELGRRMREVLKDKDANLDGRISAKEFRDAWYLRSVPIAVDAGRLPAAHPPASTGSESSPTTLSADTLLDPDHVVEVDIHIDPHDWRSLCHQSRNWQSAVEDPLDKPYTYFAADVTIDGVTIQQVGIRKKGFIGSQDTVRPSLKIKFDEFVAQTPVEGLDRMTLNNNRQDTTLLSQSLTYQLFRKAGVAAPRCAYAAVSVNGHYLGVYSHVESIRQPFLDRSFGDGSGKLYEGTLTDFYPKSIEWFEPKTENSDPDRSEIAELAEQLFSSHGKLVGRLEPLVDIDYFLRYWAVESLIRFWDGYTQNQNNFFVYLHPKEQTFYFIPWGADSCFGRGRRGRGDGPPYAVRASSILANRLYHEDGIPSRYRDVMLEILANVWDEQALFKEIQRIEKQLFDHLDFGQLVSIVALDDLRTFVQSRREHVAMELQDNWPTSVGPVTKPMYFEQVGTVTGHFTLSSDPDRSTDQATTNLHVNVNDEHLALVNPSTRWYREDSRKDTMVPTTDDGARRWKMPTHFEIVGRRDIGSIMLELQLDEDPDADALPVTHYVKGTLLGLANRERKSHPVRGQMTFEGTSRDDDLPVTFELTVFLRHEKNR